MSTPMPNTVTICLSTPSARRATVKFSQHVTFTSISIHALREEGDAVCSHNFGQSVIFLSTPSARRATYPRAVRVLAISDFYPRPPRGGRRLLCRCLVKYGQQFLSTPSARRATTINEVNNIEQGHFYPRPPRGGRPHPDTLHPEICKFLSTPSARRATGFPIYIVPNNCISIHALREEGDNLPL